MTDKPGRSIFTTTDIVRILDALVVANPSYAIAFDALRIAIGAYEPPPLRTICTLGTLDGAEYTFMERQEQRQRWDDE